MKEQEAVERLECMRLFMQINDDSNDSKFLEDDYIANEMAIKALEEVQQYRALGMTPEQVKEMQIEYCVKSTILEEYKALGTVEELRVARDKQIEKKPKRHPGNEKLNYCPSCGLYYGGLRGFEYCSDCGQKLNWKEV